MVEELALDDFTKLHIYACILEGTDARSKRCFKLVCSILRYHNVKLISPSGSSQETILGRKEITV